MLSALTGQFDEPFVDQAADCLVEGCRTFPAVSAHNFPRRAQIAIVAAVVLCRQINQQLDLKGRKTFPLLRFEHVGRQRDKLADRLASLEALALTTHAALALRVTLPDCDAVTASSAE